MGLFDYVTVRDPRFACSEGHDLSDEEFQTKDLGCTMGSATIGVDRGEARLVIDEDGGYGDTPRLPFLGRICVYCVCRRCPAFVQAATGNLCPSGVTFEVEVIDDIVRSITRVSETTSEFLANEPRKSYMVGCEGPMSYEAAKARHYAHLSEHLDRAFEANKP